MRVAYSPYAPILSFMQQAEQLDVQSHIIALERAALDRWGRGDPDGFLELCADDVIYMDPFVSKPVVGLAALRDYYEQVRGTIFVVRDVMREVRVQLVGSVAVLTFQFFSEGSENQMAWNCTEVYRRDSSDYRIIQTHWSLARSESTT